MASWAQKKKLIDPKTAKQINTAQPKTARNFTWKQEAIDKFAAEHPELVVRDGGNLLLAEPLGEQLTINYAFDDPETLRRSFAGLLEKLEANTGDRYKRLFLYFDDHPNRTFIDPVLRQGAFEVVGEMVTLVHEDVAAYSATDEIAAAIEADVEEIAALEQTCYEMAPMGDPELHDLISHGDDLLVAKRYGAIAGYVYVRQLEELTGHVARVGVRVEDRRQGIGYTLITQGLAALAGKGCVRATAFASVERKAAVDLYKKAGFAPRGTVLLYAKTPGEKVKKTLGLIGLRGIWER